MESKGKFALRTVIWAIAAAVILSADFAVKRYIIGNVGVGDKFGEIPGVANFIYIRNTGAAFSMLSGKTGILSVVSVIFSAVIAVWWGIKKPERHLLCAAAALLFAGALGNAIDRLAYGFVVDFISIKWFDFPVFNIADMSIVIGAALAIIFVIFFDTDKERKKAEADGTS